MNPETRENLDSLIVKRIPDAIILTDRDNCILQWLAGCEAIFGFSAEEATGSAIDRFLGKSPGELRVADEFSEGLKCKQKAGGEVILRIVAREVFEGGFLWICRDITAYKKIERVLNKFYDDVHAELEKLVDEKTADLKLLNEELEERVRNRTRELEDIQKKMVKQAHQAGMAEVAVKNLHDIGNILNNITTSIYSTKRSIGELPVEGLGKANTLLGEYYARIKDTLKGEETWDTLLHYYRKIDTAFREKTAALAEMISRIEKKADEINVILSDQNGITEYAVLFEWVNLQKEVELALADAAGLFAYYRIRVNNESEWVPHVKVQRQKLQYVLSCLLKNAAEAMKDCPEDNRLLNVRLKNTEEGVVLSFSDTGRGIAGERLSRVFNQEFDPRERVSRIDLHTCANYMKEMNGKISVASKGEGGGACYTIQLTVE